MVSDLWSMLLRQVTEMFKLYTREKYVLAVDQWQKRDFEVLVAFKVCIFPIHPLELMLPREFFLDTEITNAGGSNKYVSLEKHVASVLAL